MIQSYLNAGESRLERGWRMRAENDGLAADWPGCHNLSAIGWPSVNGRSQATPPLRLLKTGRLYVSQTVTTILPNCSLDSMKRYASMI